MHYPDTRTVARSPARYCRSEAAHADVRAADELKALMGALAHLQTGIVVVDRRARIVVASRPAQLTLSECGLAWRTGEVLRAATPRATAQLADALADAGGDECGIAIGRIGDAPLMAWIARLPENEDTWRDNTWREDAPATAVYISDPRRCVFPSERDLQVRFGLRSRPLAWCS